MLCPETWGRRMIDWKLAYRWTRNILAILGALGCALVLLVVGLFLAQAPFHSPDATMATQAPDELERADSLLNEAGIERAQQELALLGSNPGEWLQPGNSYVELWCLRAPGLKLGERWLRPGELQPMFARAAATTIEAMHRAHACVPSWREVQERGRCCSRCSSTTRSAISASRASRCTTASTRRFTCFRARCPRPCPRAHPAAPQRRPSTESRR